MRSSRREPSRRRGVLVGIALVAPCLICLTIAFALPLFNLLSFSFYPYLGPAEVGNTLTLENYERLLSDALIGKIMLRTLALGVTVVVLNIVLAYPIAYFLARSSARYRGAIVFCVISPLLVSAIVRNLGWFPILSSNGMVSWITTSFGFAPISLLNTFTGVALALTHALLPLLILTLYTTIQRIDPEIERAAINLGAHPFHAFMRVVLPLTRPGLVGGGLLVFSIAISAFTTPAFMGGNRVIVMAIYIAQQVRSALDYATASTASVILLVSCILLSMLALRSQRVGGEN